jgi:hypothetical protein
MRSSSQRIWIGQASLRVLAFIQENPEGVSMGDLIARYYLIRRETLFAALGDLERDGKITIDHGNTVCPVNME